MEIDAEPTDLLDRTWAAAVHQARGEHGAALELLAGDLARRERCILPLKKGVAMPDATYNRIKVEPTSGALGAEVAGVDLATRVDDATFAEIYRAWLEHHVLFFRDQHITPAQQTVFAERFGELEAYPFIAPLPEHPFV